MGFFYWYNFEMRRHNDGQMGHHARVFAKKFWVTSVLTVPILLYSPVFKVIVGGELPEFTGLRLVLLVLGTVVFFYGGSIFIKGAGKELKAKKPGMMTLISLAIVTAYFYSLFQVFLGREETLFWELSTLIAVMLLGHWVEMKAVAGTRGALRELSDLLPDTAEKEVKAKNSGVKTETVPLDKLKAGDIIIIRPGGKVAADGEVIEGESDVNESLATGESKPASKKPGSEVIGGTMNGDGSLRIKVTRIGEDTFLAGVIRLVKEAQASKSKLQLLSDKAAFYLTIVAVVAGLVTLLVWLPIKGADFGFTRMVAVLVIACPHALGLAIPLVASISIGKAAKRGFLVRDRLSLEVAREIDLVLFDKTGTLTTGDYGVKDVFVEEGYSSKEVLCLAASVESRSEHPVGRAIVKEIKKEGIYILPVDGFRRLPGKGVGGVVGKRKIMVGGEALIRGCEGLLSSRAKQFVNRGKGGIVVYVIKEQKLAGMIALGDVIREESREAVQELKMQGVKVGMITGDLKDVAEWVAEELGISDYFAEVLPDKKASQVKDLQKEGYRVAMVGDGINDAPALAQADVGVAIGAGTNVAVETAGIVLVRNDPRDVAKIIKLSRLTHAKMVQNLFWATGYNVVALPLAAGVAAFWGIYLSPAFAALLMSLSTVIVAVNAVTLRGSKID